MYPPRYRGTDCCARSGSSTWSTVRSRKARSWLTSTVPARSFRTKSSRMASPSMSRSLVGSSSRKMSYRDNRSDARFARAACPPDSEVIGASSRTPSPSEAATFAVRSSKSAPPRFIHRSNASAYASSAPASPVSSAAVAVSSSAAAPTTPVRRPMNASTLSPARRSGSCGRYPTVAVAGFSDTDPASYAPSSSPASIRSNVDFPAPLAPTSPVTLPGDTTRSTPEKMARSACPADSPLAVSTAFTRSNLGPGRVCQVDRVGMSGPAERELPASRGRHVDDGRPGSAHDGPLLNGPGRGAAGQPLCGDLQAGPGRVRSFRDPEDLVVVVRRRGRDERVCPEHGDDLTVGAEHVRHGHGRRIEPRARPGRERAVGDGPGARAGRGGPGAGDVRRARGAGRAVEQDPGRRGRGGQQDGGRSPDPPATAPAARLLDQRLGFPGVVVGRPRTGDGGSLGEKKHP